MSKDVFLDTKGTCFLCLQEPVSDIENVNSEVSLQTICRCLNIIPTSFPWKELPPKKKCDISVNMCSICSSTTKKLTDLINQIEMITNLLTYQLQVFHRTIKNSSDGNPDCFQTLKELPAMKELGTGSVEVDFMQRLRTAIKENCSKRIKEIEARNFPRVLLERLGPKTEIFQDEAQIPPQSADDPYDDLPGNGIPAPTSDKSSCFPKEFLKDLCEKYSTQTGSEYLCSICKFVSPQGLPRFRVHLVLAHPEIIFISQKAYHLNDLKLRALTKRLFTKEIRQAKDRGGIINGKQCLPCEFCNRKHFSHSNLKHHLLVDHFKIMEERLDQLITAPPLNQDLNLHKKRTTSNLEGLRAKIETPDPSQIPSPHFNLVEIGTAPSTFTNSDMDFHKQLANDLCKKNYSKTDEKYCCSVCNYSTPLPFRIRIHLVNAHPQVFFLSQKPSLMSDAKFSETCRRLYSTEVLKAKQRGNVIGKESFPCENCSMNYFCKSNFKCHLLLEHFKILKRKLDDLFKAPSSSQKKGTSPNPKKSNRSWVCGPGEDGCGRVYWSQRALEKHRNDFCVRMKDKKIWICSGDDGCGSQFKSPHNLKRHLRKNTCQKVKARNLNLLEDTDTQPDDPSTFIVPDLVVEETMQNCETKAVKNSNRKYRNQKKWICNVKVGGCGKIFSTNSSLMNHKRSHCSSLNNLALQRHQENTCSKKTKKEVEPEDNFNVEMECSVGNVEISKIEVMDSQDESEVFQFENIQEFEVDPLQL